MQTDADSTKFDWFVPRTAEARRVLAALMDGPARAFRLFGPRRIGKTWFLLLDLARMAEDAGHKVVYVDFWRGEGRDPADLFLTELQQATFAGYLNERLATLKKAELNILGSGGSAEFSDTPPATRPRLDLLAEELSRIANPEKPALLLLDEFQKVSDAPGGADFIAVLRSVLNRNPTGLRSVFTGSSQSGLNRIFSAEEAPFFRYADSLELEELGERFITALLEKARQGSAAVFTDAEAMAVFEHYDRSPMWFNRWLTKLYVYPSLTPEQARAAIESDVARDNGYNSLVSDMSRAQRISLWILAAGNLGSTGKAAMDHIENLGLPRPTKSSLNAALQALDRRGLIEKSDNGAWRLKDSLLADWYRRQNPDLVLAEEVGLH